MVVDNKTSLTIRRHPSENINKYSSFCCQGLNVFHDSDDDLIKSISKHNHIIGYNSMAQVVGKLCGKHTINILIDGYGEETIPDKYIEQTVRFNMPKTPLPKLFN